MMMWFSYTIDLTLPRDSTPATDHVNGKAGEKRKRQFLDVTTGTLGKGTFNFRRSVADCCTKPYHDDYYLLRWLRARNFNPEAAEKMLREGAAILANSGRRDLDFRTSKKVNYMKDSRSLTFGDKLLSPRVALRAGFFVTPTRTSERQGRIQKISIRTDTWFELYCLPKLGVISRSMKWREKWEVETLNTWEPPEVIKKYYPSGLAGFDKEGAPVVVIPFAGLDMWGMLHSLNKADFIRMTIKMIETYQGIAWEQSKKCGQAAGTVSAIIDMENFNLRQYAWRPAPKIFAIAFSVVKNFLNEYTLNKIKIFKNDPRKYQPLLLQIIDDNQLPKHYGGTMTDPDGDPTCPSKVQN
uniref:CRAL-TRIO domain-containing protein n=1 Tax=Timema douglasi TaxID=61478 RepID=A0A7R8Z6E8_TIMDO|nr:unnamed protein product [Timema douglasi]